MPGSADEHDVAAAPPVAARGPAARHVLLTPERDGAVAAVSGDHANGALVDEPHGEGVVGRRR